MTTITVSMIDDHPMVIDGVQKMLEKTNIKFLEGYSSEASLLEGLKRQEPDVLLLDIQMPDKSGQELLPELKSHYPQMRIVALTGFVQAFYIKNMLYLGASGYVLKSADKLTIIKAIRAAYDHQQFIDPSLQPFMKGTELKPAPHLSSSILSKREKEIIQLLAQGFTSSEIAQKLSLSITTVKNYRSNLHLKLDATNVVTLLQHARDMKLI